jgi:hypothetical protein
VAVNETVRLAERFRDELHEMFPEVHFCFYFGRNIQNEISSVSVRVANFNLYGQPRDFNYALCHGYDRSCHLESLGPYDHLCGFSNSVQISLWVLAKDRRMPAFPGMTRQYIRVPRYGSVAGYFIDANREGLQLSALQEIHLGDLLSRE